MLTIQCAVLSIEQAAICIQCACDARCATLFFHYEVCTVRGSACVAACAVGSIARRCVNVVVGRSFLGEALTPALPWKLAAVCRMNMAPSPMYGRYGNFC